MLKRLAVIALCFIALLTSVADAQSERQVFHEFRTLPNDLVRYRYLTTVIPQLSPEGQAFAKQLLATVDAELGLYTEAVHDFPFDNRLTMRAPLPELDPWLGGAHYDGMQAANRVVTAHAAKAVDAITELASAHRIVVINEAHHNPQTRALILALLPHLRAIGYNYFAPEALTEDGAMLKKRGYPLDSSGTEYLHEPIYGEILREAARLGYTIVSYDATDATEDRDTAQANNLYEKVFAKDPHARLFVEAGYAHIDKAKGNLNDSTPMALQLARLSGLDPLSVDQTQFWDAEPSFHGDTYHELVRQYHPLEAIVLKFNSSDGVWSSDPKRHDVSVILPKAKGTPRPSWLSLDDARQPWPINTALCAERTPCVVEAHYINEPDNAVAADRYAFLQGNDSSELYLRPGSYRLRAWGENGATLSDQTIQVVPKP